MKRFSCILLMLCCLFALPVTTVSEEEQPLAPVIDTLKAAWTAEYQNFGVTDGYFEIKNTRVITIKDDVSAAGEYAEAFFGEIAVIYEFILMENWYNAAPYYASTGAMNNVVLYKDGTLEIAPRSLFHDYRARTYSMDFTGIIESIEDLGPAYNEVCDLLAQ